jgi:hypothetical protein
MEISKENREKKIDLLPSCPYLKIRKYRDIGPMHPILTLLHEELNLPPYFFPLEISQADFAVPPSAFYSPDFLSFLHCLSKST